MRRLTFRTYAAVVILTKTVQPISGQAPPGKDISESARCKTCQVVLDSVAVLSLANDDFFPYISVVRDSRGGFLVAPISDRARLAIFSPSGRFERFVGRPGSDPGEYELAGLLAVGPNDSIYVFDGMLQRLTVLTNQMRVARISPAPPQIGRVILLSRGEYLAQAHVGTPEALGLPLHIIDARGRILRSFGSLDGDLPVGASLARHITSGGQGAVWTIPSYEFRLERWSLTGERQVALNRQPDWITGAPSEGKFVPEDERRPSARFRGISQRQDGSMWVLATVAKRDWRPDPRWSGRTSGERPILEPTLLSKYVDTVIELIDPAQAQLVASTRVPWAVNGFVDDDLVYSRGRSTNGREQIRIWRLRLKRQ
jgi:hypothetical protein